MKVLLVYISPNKTTLRISRLISRVLIDAGHQVVEWDMGSKKNRVLSEIDHSICRDIDLIGIGGPVYHLRLLEPMTEFLHRNLPHVKRESPDAKSFIYLTYAGITTGKVFLKTANMLEKHGFGIVGGMKVKAPEFWEKAEFPDTAAADTVQSLMDACGTKNYKIMDKQSIRRKFACQNPFVRIIYPLTGLIGKLRVPKSIVFDREKCNACNRCYNECPVGAMTMGDFPVRDKRKCVYCYHCTVACSRQAMSIDAGVVQRVVNQNMRIIGVETPANEFYS